MSHRDIWTPISPAATTTGRRLFLATILTLILTILPMSRLITDARIASPAAGDPNAPSPAGPNADVIAQGVATLPTDQIAWRLVQDTAESLGEAIFEERALGF